MSDHIEMIIDYITDGTDYQYNDNHGILVRCKDCKFTQTDGMDDYAIYCKKWDRWEMPPEGYCYKGRKKN